MDKMEELLSHHQEQARYFKVGDVTEGEIIAVSKTSVLLDLDGKGLGIVFGRELGEDFSKENYKIGDRVLASILELENDEGRIVLSFRRASKEEFWRRLKSLFEKKESFTVKPVEANQGGLLVEINNIQGFLPVSQLSPSHYPRIKNGDKDEIYHRLLGLVGKPLSVQILDLDPQKNKLILSERAASFNQRKELLSSFKIGDRLKGKITGIVDFGAFVDVGGLEGLIHISEISWDKVDDISKYLKVGKEYEVMVIGTDNDRLSLSLKRLLPDSFTKIVKKYKTGQEVGGEISKITPFGVLVKFDKLEGLISSAEIKKDKSTYSKETLSEGNKVRCKILSIEPQQRKIYLTLKSIQKTKK